MSDTDIANRVIGAIRQNRAWRGADLGVEVAQGVVTLTGTLESHESRAAAREAAYAVEGVLEVVNRTTVVLRGTPPSRAASNQ
jgi:osmotically-inducible protein OsmY